MGHLESAAGVAGLIKTVLAMNHGVIPPHLHFSDPTPEVDWERMPLRVTSESTPWPLSADRPPLAGINVFGISGANAHAVIEGYRSPDDPSAATNGRQWPVGAPVRVPSPEAVEDAPATGPPEQGTPRLLPLSAKTPEALRELAGRYLAWLDAPPCGDGVATAGPASGSSPADMAWTASVGRSHFEHRAGVVFSDEESLRSGLAAVASGEPVPGRDPGDPPGVPSQRGADVVAAAAAYEAGEDVSFERLFDGETRRRIPLPGYPFQRRRHWVEPRRAPERPGG